MKFLSIITLTFIAFSLHSVSYAQSSLEGFSTGRYEVRKSAPKMKRNPAQAEPAKKEEAAQENSAEVVTATTTTTTVPVVQAKAAVSPAPSPVATASPSPAAETKVVEKSVEPSIGAQAEALFTNKANKIYDYYAETIDPEDIRNNRLEVEITPMAVYNESTSNYSFRQYQSFFDALRFKANVWFTPLIGVSGKFLFSMAADIDSMAADKSRVTARYEFMDVGLNFRRYFGSSLKANSLEFSILYSDNKMNTPTDAQNRLRISTSGLGLGLKARLPSSADYAWIVGGNFFPRIQHKETQSAGGVNSGAVGDNSRIGLEFGGEWRLSRSSQLLWGLEASAEKNMFDGSASQPDPSTGVTPKNVSVTNSLYTFSLGYRWGH